MTSLELLSPAKNLECGIAAIDHGADAVYIGATRFGARAAAGNSVEDIRTLCDYAHQFDAKVYVTINTLLYDDELEAAAQLCQDVTAAGADAILVQDLRLIEKVSSFKFQVSGFQGVQNVQGSTPSLTGEGRGGAPRFHASTQTDNRTIEKVKELAQMGLRRVVLARELSIKEIAAIHEAVPEVELEVFVHGALCVSYSGRCYASEYCFGRSANRGECAQFCRLPFTLQDADGNIIEQNRHLLSLKDMAQLDNLERLVKAGAVSFKIEGRLKDADYVKNITAAYSEKLNSIIKANPGLYKRASMGRSTYTFKPDIHKSFNRGFTTYFADGRAPHQASMLTPKSIGEYVGKVKEIRGNRIIVSSVLPFTNGDGLCFFNAQGSLVGFRVNIAEGNRIIPFKMPAGIQQGTVLYRNFDQAFQKVLTKPSGERKVLLDMALTIKADELLLSVTDEHGHQGQASLPYSYQETHSEQEDNMRRQLTKLGGTAFSVGNLQINYEVEKPFVPSSQLTALRREAIKQCIMHNAQFIIKDSQSSQNPQLPADNYALCIMNYEFLMHCRYCLRHELGYCTKQGKKAPWREPLSLHLADGKSFTLKFDCRQCEMYVMR